MSHLLCFSFWFDRRSSTSAFLACCAVGLSCFAVGCVGGINLEVPSQFVVLDDRAYDFRATTVDGFVIAGNAIDKEEGQGSDRFWAEAVKRTLEPQGYALIEESKVKSADGLAGRLLRFGLDLDLETHIYQVVVFVGDEHLYVIEVGGTEEQFARHADQVKQVIESFEVD